MSQRVIDVMIAVPLLALILPIMLLIALAIAVTSPGPVLYRQRRYGLGGRMFHMVKFRTMRVDADAELARLMETDAAVAAEMQGRWKLADDPRVTPLGSILRRLTLDELPQLWNVIVGHMSLVGPRPRREPAELAGYGDAVDVLLSVRPGLTGPWQVAGRNSLPEEVRVELDLSYARERSLGTDLLLLCRTIPSLLRPGRNGAC